MSNQNRIYKGGRVDRDQAINFKFNGKEYVGYQGDTLASALLANDVHLICLLYTSPSPRDATLSRMPSSA